MLVITRRVGERFLIGPDIVVAITGVNGNQVRLGILAPPNVKILREELVPRAHNEGEGEIT
jgi:carbon storage regulator